LFPPSGENNIGKAVYEFLRDQRGVPVSGCGSCWQQCDVTHMRKEDSWWYVPMKNKQKLRSRFARRKEEKMRIAAIRSKRETAASPQEEKQGSWTTVDRGI